MKLKRVTDRFRRITTMAPQHSPGQRFARALGNGVQWIASALGLGEDEDDEAARAAARATGLHYRVPRAVYGGRSPHVDDHLYERRKAVDDDDDDDDDEDADDDEDMEDEDQEEELEEDCTPHRLPPEVFQVISAAKPSSPSLYERQDSLENPPVVLFKGGEYVHVPGTYRSNYDMDDDEGEAVCKGRPGGLSDWAVTVGFLIAMMGGGMLVMPWVLSQSGLWEGCIVTIFTAILSAYTCIKLLKHGKVYSSVLQSGYGRECHHIGDLAGAVLGVHAARFVHVVLCGLLLGIAIAYGLIMVGSIESLIEGSLKLMTIGSHRQHVPAGTITPEPVVQRLSGSNVIELCLSALCGNGRGGGGGASEGGEEGFHVNNWRDLGAAIKICANDVLGLSFSRMASAMGLPKHGNGPDMLKMVAVAVSACITIPLACLRDAGWLAKGNSLALACLLYLYMFIVSQGVLKGFRGPSLGGGVLDESWDTGDGHWGYGSFRFAAVLVPIFFTHHAILPLHQVAKNQHHTKKNVGLAYALALFVFLSAGILGAYSRHQKDGQGAAQSSTRADEVTVPMNYLDSFNPALAIPMSVRLATVLLGSVSLPSLLCMVRIQIFGVALKKEYPSVFLVFLLNVAVFGLITTAVYFELGIADVLGLVGSCCGSFLVFILPAIINMRFSALREFGERHLVPYLIDYLVIIIGTLTFVGYVVWLIAQHI